MGISFDKESSTWTAFFSKRHPLTRQPRGMRRTGFKSQAEAKRAEIELAILVDKKFHEAVVPRWSSLVEDFRRVALEKGMTEKTVENYFVCLKAHTFDDWGSRSVDSITTEEIRVLIKSKVGDRTASHQKNVLKFIRGVFKFGLEVGVINRNPAPIMKFRTGDKIKRVLTEPQVQILLSKAKEFRWEWYPHVAMALYTGMRNGELYALTWDKVNLDEKTILIDSSWNKIDGFKSTKSGDDRIAEIAPPLLTMLWELKLRSADSHFVLPRITQWDEGHQAAALRMFLTGLGMPVVRFHDLRATWCTLMLGKGKEPAGVMTMGGWKDIKTMMVYMRKAGISIKGIMNGFNLHNPSRETAKILELSARSEV